MLRSEFYDLVRSAVAGQGYFPYFLFEGDESLTFILSHPAESDMPMMSDTDIDIREHISGWEEVPALLGVPEVEGVALVALQTPNYTNVRAYVMFVKKGETNIINLRRLEMVGAANDPDFWDPCGNLTRSQESLARFFNERKGKGYQQFSLAEGTLKAVLIASQKCPKD